MSEKFYSTHSSGVDDGVALCHSTFGSFTVRQSKGRLHVGIGSAFMILSQENAVLLRDLLDAGIADAVEYLASSAYRVDLVKAAA
ncbi:hypothetical protein [Nocardia sp. NPDC050175]|uniref:hypothetical protein n=1 Tax=Nocardia sp. NPDC050175 TaxID=3364317 RepID=UPI00379D55D4